jgi:hypothetical protein
MWKWFLGNSLDLFVIEAGDPDGEEVVSRFGFAPNSAASRKMTQAKLNYFELLDLIFHF